MGVTISSNEVELNSIKYPLIGRVQRVLASVMPEKQVIGDYTIDSDPAVSTWVIADQRGGLLTEEITSDRDYLSYWWSTLQTNFRKSFTLPDEATAVTTIPVVPTGYIDPDGTEDADTAWDDEATVYDGNTNTFAVTNPEIPLSSWSSYLVVKLTEAVYCDNIRIFPNREGTDVNLMDVDAWYGGAWNDCSSADFTPGDWNTIAVPGSQWVYKIRIRFYNNNGSTTKWAAVHEVDFIGEAVTVQLYPQVYCNYNSQLYAAFDNVIGKLNTTTGTSFDYVAAMPGTITDMFHDGTTLYIMLGASEYYWYMNTSEVFAPSTTLIYTYGIVWDNKTFGFILATNTMYQITNPATTTASQTAKGAIPVAASTTQSLFKYYDANGDDIIYAPTKSGLYAYDYSNAQWLETQVKQAEHTTGGKGAVVFQEGCFISSGLNVLKYTVGTTATINRTGLDQKDGLPTLRNGEIVKFFVGINEFYALIDSTYEGATSRSTLMSWDGNGWRVLWEATADNKNMYTGIVSAAKEQRIWWSTTDSPYFIKLPTNSLKPKKNSARTYAASGTHYTGWFDGGWANRNKLALRLRVKTKGCTANETVTISYRADHTNVDLATGWTSIGTAITTNTTTTYTFVSGVGLEFNAIQFKIALAASTANTSSPEIEWIALEYQKVVPTRWSYGFTVDCTKAHAGRSAAQLLDALVTATETGTLIALSYRDSTTYTINGVVTQVTGNLQTGEMREGQYNVTFLVP